MVVYGADKLLKYIQSSKPKIEKKHDQRIFTFDIECSNGYIIDGIARPFDYSKPPCFYNQLQKASVCYLWQMGVDDMYFYGRDLQELIPVFDLLASQEHTTICYIHNLSYEFSFLIGILTFDHIFARSNHKPIYAQMGNLIFRCSYMLSRQALSSIGQNVGFKKLTEVFEYDSIRTPKSHLTDNEIRYGIRDLEILRAYIDKMINEYEYIQKIPLTQTGRPRKDVKDIYKKDWGYHQKMTKLLPRDAAEYARQKAAFVGGWVHANYYYVNVNLKNCVVPWDITSSYPLQMILRKFPQTPWSECDDPADFDFYLESPHFLELMEIECVNIKSSGYNDYISTAKIKEGHAVKAENGRIYAAGYFKMFVTSVDYDIIKEAYHGEINILRLWYSRAGYLDKRYVNYILELYNNKVLLTHTGDPVKDELRARSKELLNSLYGLMVASLIYPEILFDPIHKEWQPFQFQTPEDLEAFTNDELDKLRQKPWKNFQSYSAGIFVTAWARRSLYDIVSLLNKDVVYHDTDSVYCIGDHRDVIEDYNNKLKQELLTMAERRGIDPEKLHPKDPKGVEQWIGIYVSDTGGAPFAEFKTLGAKRYAYRIKMPPKGYHWVNTKDEMIKITVSGVSKVLGPVRLKDDMNNFKDDIIFDYKECGKLMPHYLTNQKKVRWIDRDGIEYISKQKCGVCLQPARYMMGMGDFLETLASMGSLSNQFSEMEIEELMEMGGL